MNTSASSDYNKFTPSVPPTYGSEGSHTAPNQVEPKVLGPWSTGICDCFSDPRNCCITLWCPCVTFGQIAEIIDEGSNSCGVNGALYTILSCVPGVPCIYSCIYRSKMREQYMLKESPCGDCLVHTFCDPCALCQEYRELQNRGFDMSLGWHGNVERQNGGVAMAPIVEGGMIR